MNLSEMTPIKRHYILLFPLFCFFITVAFVFGVKTIWISYFNLGFLWSWVLLTPELKEKVRSQKYKFSLFRLIFWFDRKVEDQLFFETTFSLRPISRASGVLLFSFLFSLSSGFEIFLSAFVGVVVGEGWLYINKKYYPEAYQRNDSNLSENSL